MKQIVVIYQRTAYDMEDGPPDTTLFHNKFFESKDEAEAYLQRNEPRAELSKDGGYYLNRDRDISEYYSFGLIDHWAKDHYARLLMIPEVDRDHAIFKANALEYNVSAGVYYSYLTYDEHFDQAPKKNWKCPRTRIIGKFDQKYFDNRHGKEES